MASLFQQRLGVSVANTLIVKNQEQGLWQSPNNTILQKKLRRNKKEYKEKITKTDPDIDKDTKTKPFGCISSYVETRNT